MQALIIHPSLTLYEPLVVQSNRTYKLFTHCLHMPKDIKLAFVENMETKSVFKQKLQYLLNRIKELTTLFGVEACALIYDPHNPRPLVWPSASEAQSLISRMENMPDSEKKEAESDLEDFLKQRLSKLTEELKQAKLETEAKEITWTMFQCASAILSDNFTDDELDSLSSSELNDLGIVIQKTMEQIKQRIETLEHSPATTEAKDIGEAMNGESVDEVYEVKMESLENPSEHIELEPDFESLLASADEDFMNSLWAA